MVQARPPKPLRCVIRGRQSDDGNGSIAAMGRTTERTLDHAFEVEWSASEAGPPSVMKPPDVRFDNKPTFDDRGPTGCT